MAGALLLSAFATSCGTTELARTAESGWMSAIDSLQGKIKLDSLDLGSAMYSDQVAFIRVQPRPRTWAYFRDVRLRRAHPFDDWVLDREYLLRVIVPRMEAKNIEVGLPSRWVLADSPGALMGVYERKLRVRAVVGKRIVTHDVDRPRVMRTTLDEPWSLHWASLTGVLGGKPSQVFIVFPFDD